MSSMEEASEPPDDRPVGEPTLKAPGVSGTPPPSGPAAGSVDDGAGASTGEHGRLESVAANGASSPPIAATPPTPPTAIEAREPKAEGSVAHDGEGKPEPEATSGAGPGSTPHYDEEHPAPAGAVASGAVASGAAAPGSSTDVSSVARTDSAVSELFTTPMLNAAIEANGGLAAVDSPSIPATDLDRILKEVGASKVSTMESPSSPESYTTGSPPASALSLLEGASLPSVPILGEAPPPTSPPVSGKATLLSTPIVVSSEGVTARRDGTARATVKRRGLFVVSTKRPTNGSRPTSPAGPTASAGSAHVPPIHHEVLESKETPSSVKPKVPEEFHSPITILRDADDDDHSSSAAEALARAAAAVEAASVAARMTYAAGGGLAKSKPRKLPPRLNPPEDPPQKKKGFISRMLGRFRSKSDVTSAHSSRDSPRPMSPIASSSRRSRGGPKSARDSFLVTTERRTSKSGETEAATAATAATDDDSLKGFTSPEAAAEHKKAVEAALAAAGARSGAPAGGGGSARAAIVGRATRSRSFAHSSLSRPMSAMQMSAIPKSKDDLTVLRSKSDDRIHTYKSILKNGKRHFKGPARKKAPLKLSFADDHDLPLCKTCYAENLHYSKKQRKFLWFRL